MSSTSFDEEQPTGVLEIDGIPVATLEGGFFGGGFVTGDTVAIAYNATGAAEEVISLKDLTVGGTIAMRTVCAHCEEAVRRYKGMLVHDRSGTVFCGPRDGYPLPEPCTTARTAIAQEIEPALTGYRPRRHKVMRRAK